MCIEEIFGVSVVEIIIVICVSETLSSYTSSKIAANKSPTTSYLSSIVLAVVNGILKQLVIQLVQLRIAEILCEHFRVDGSAH